MNDKLIRDITCYIKQVGRYLYMEYDSVYYDQFDKQNMFDFVGSYYMGGNSVPDTARYVVELILMNRRENGQIRS